jgi:hypothetical protein
VLALALLTAAPACTHSKPKAAVRKLPPSTTTTTLPEFKLVVASVDVQAMKYEQVKLPDDVKAQVTTTLSNYLEKAVVEPLRTGQAAVGLDAVFTPVALARLTPGTADRAALIEEPGTAGSAVAPDKEDVSLVVLASQSGDPSVISATIDFGVIVTTPTGQVKIERTGEVVLLPTLPGWRVDSYDVVAKRDTVPPPPPTTTTTAKKGA